ncbi:hypothetical protein GGI24_000451 [Coemansia furcata]|nr:hypothetical protein GGI24_000451 [Coemansia furcata]
MSSFDEYTFYFNDISRMFSDKALYETYILEPKTRVEMRMIKASTFIRSTPEWADRLNDEEKCLEWTTQVMGTFNLTDKEVEYVFDELKYYALLKENGVAGEELGAIDNVWITNAASDCELADEFKRNAAVLERDMTQDETGEGVVAPLTGLRALVDPFLYPFETKESSFLTKPVESPEDSLNPDLPRVKPELMREWFRAIRDFNSCQSNSGAEFDSRELSQLVERKQLANPNELYKSWLPTDFNVNEDGSVTIRSYINNLHPIRYAALYQSISKVFAKFVPLLEQVATDMVHPRDLRAEFSRDYCIAPGMLGSRDLYRMLDNGEEIPEEYQKYLKTSTWIFANTTKEQTYVDSGYFDEEYAEAEIYTEPVPDLFCPPDRPLKPYSMREMPLQTSVEMININLTPENPAHPEGEWQAVGRAEERIFAVGLYFYDVENISSAKLKFRDPVWRGSFNGLEDYYDFCKAHDIEIELYYGCHYTQEVGEVDIKSGGYICYPNFYQTKMPTFELKDPTQPGHVKYIAFYTVDPDQRLVSTEIIPPQQPHWTGTTTSLDQSDSVISTKECLEMWHSSHNRKVKNKFDCVIHTGGY